MDDKSLRLTSWGHPVCHWSIYVITLLCPAGRASYLLTI